MNASFLDLLDKYDLDARSRDYSLSQIKLTRLVITLFDKFLKSEVEASKITADHYRYFMVDLATRHAISKSGKESFRLLSDTTKHTYARVLKAFFSWLLKRNYIVKNPLEKVHLPHKPSVVPKIYSEEELIAVSAAVVGTRNRAIYELFLDSGIRLKELTELRMGDIEIDEGVVTVKGKGKKQRPSYFSTITAANIGAYIKELRSNAKKDDRLFIKSSGQPMTKSGIQSMLYRLGLKAKLKERLAPHKLRHTFTTLSMENGANLEYLRKLLGHSDIKTTSDNYLNVRDKTIRAAHSKFSPVMNLNKLNRDTPPEGPTKEYSAKRNERLQESPIKGEQDLASPMRMKIESGDPCIKSFYWDRYVDHLRKLSNLVVELIRNIDNGKIEQLQNPGKIKFEGGFAPLNLKPVYPAQNNNLWPFLSQHLDNEFKKPRLTEQIDKSSLAVILAKLQQLEYKRSDLNVEIREKLVLISERGTFVGTCNICKTYLE